MNVGNAVFVDAVNGNDSTGLRGRSDLPFLTLAAAKTAASSGDTITVRPGSYSGTNLLKDGVNWYFYPGGTVTQTSGSGIFDDTSSGANGSVTSVIGGSGRFISNAYVIKSNAPASNITLNADFIGGSNQFLVKHSGTGTITINANQLYSATGPVIWWLYGSGDMVVNAHVIQGVKTAIYCSGTASGGGQLYVRSDLIKETSAALSSEFGAISVSGTNQLDSRVWVYASQIESVNNAAVHVKSNKLYVTAQKIFGPITNDGGELWVMNAKLSPLAGQSSIGVNLTAGTSYITSNQIEDSTTSTADLIYVSGGTHYVGGLAATRVNNGNGVSVSGGYLTLTGLSIKTLASYSDLVQTGGVLTVLGCSYDTAKISGTITQGDPRVAGAAQLGSGTSLPADGSVYQLFVTGGHFYGWNGSLWMQLDN